MASRSKASVFGRSLAGIVGSNPARGMDIFCECCVLSFSQMVIPHTHVILHHKIPKFLRSVVLMYPPIFYKLFLPLSFAGSFPKIVSSHLSLWTIKNYVHDYLLSSA